MPWCEFGELTSPSECSHRLSDSFCGSWSVGVDDFNISGSFMGLEHHGEVFLLCAAVHAVGGVR